MKNTRGVYAGTAALALSAGLLFNTPAASAASQIDLPDQAGNTVQVSTGPGVFQPQFTLWPIPNVSHNDARDTNPNAPDANDAINRGNNTTGQAWPFGFGAGNVVQFATGGNIVNPQFAVGTNNNSSNVTFGNVAGSVGNNSTSDSTGQPGQGLLIDGNGNVFQVAFLQGNIIAPQVAVLGNNNSNQIANGNFVSGAGNGSTTQANNGFAFITGNGNVIQIEILSDNVIAPQVAVGGNNNLIVDTEGNETYDAGNDASTNVNGSNPLAGIFAVTGNGNVTQIAILSNNVWAPQIALPGKNTSAIATNVNDSQVNGNGSDTTGDAAPVVTHPVLDPIRSTLNTLTGNTNRPVLDAVQNALPVNQFGNGNSDQTANNSGAISNPQIAFKPSTKVAAPVQTNLVTNSFVAKPTTLAGDNKPSGGSSTTTGSTTTSNWKPGDGIKKVVSAVSNALKPKPKASDSGTS